MRSVCRNVPAYSCGTHRYINRVAEKGKSIGCDVVCIQRFPLEHARDEIFSVCVRLCACGSGDGWRDAACM